MDTDSPYCVFRTKIQEFPPHWHEEFEIIYNLDDSFLLGIGDEEIWLEKGDIYIVEPRIIHAFKPQDIPRDRFIIQFRVKEMHVLKGYNESVRFYNPLLKADDNNPLQQLVQQAMEDIITEVAQDDGGSKYMIMSNLYKIFGTLMRNVELENISEGEINLRRVKTDKIQRIFDYVVNNFKKDITLDKAADYLGYSKYYLAHFFKDETGMTFMNYVNHYRIMIAGEWLLESEATVTEICMDVGFNSIKTFNRVFKSIKGLPPSKYKKQYLRSE